MTAPVTLTWDAPDPATCEHSRMVDGVYRITATPLGDSGEPGVTENPARQCARCGWIDGRVPYVRLPPPGMSHHVRVGFVPNPPEGPTMNDFIRDWITEREQLEQAAAPGPWHWEPPSGDDWPTYDESLVTEDGEAVLMGWGYDASGIEGAPADREFIVDARTSLPAARAALKAVLELEGPTAIGQYDDWSKGYHAALDACREAIEAALRGES